MATEATNFTVVSGVENATLTWSASETTNLLAWLIEQKIGANGSWVKLPQLEPSKRSETYTKLPAKEEVFFRVWAIVKQNAKEAHAVIQSPPAAKIQIGLTADKTGVEIVSAPAGTAKVGFAYMKNLAGEGVQYTSLSYPLTKPYVPPVGDPVVDAQALTAGNTSIGGWAGRIQTVPFVEPPHEETPAEKEAKEKAEKEAHEKAEREAKEKAEKEQHEKEEKEKEPHEEPPKTNFKRGMNAGGWTQSQEVADAKKLGVNPVVRLDGPSSTTPFTSTGTAVIYLNSGGTSTSAPHFTPEARAHRNRVLNALFPAAEINLRNEKLGYNTGGVKALSTSAVVADAVAVCKKHPDIWAYEYLNEPGGNWFWGSGAEGSSNSAAYVAQLKAIYEALVKEFGAKRPLLFASADGGHLGNNAWLNGMLSADKNVVNYVDAFTCHPYDGSGANPSSTLVHWGAVEEVHKITGKPIAITEYGRPLTESTGDSPKSTEAQQANADGAMVHKGKESGFVLCVAIYGYRAGKYGIFSSGDTPLPAVAAIAAA